MDDDQNNEILSCGYCQKIFSNKHNLKVHQNTAKYCLKLRDSTAMGTATPLNHCLHCDKSFTSKQTLTYHIRICRKVLIHELKEYYTKQLREAEDEYKSTIKVLQEKIQTLESKIKEKTVFHLA